MLHVCTHGSGQHDRFKVTTTAGELGNVVAVRHSGDILFDDRSFIEVAGHVVRRGTDDLHATIMRLAIRVGADECGEERVVDVDHLAVPLVGEPRGQHQHVAGEDDEIEIQ